MHEAELYGRVLTVNRARTSARVPGEGAKPIWQNDLFLRQQLDDREPTQQELEHMSALLNISEVQEAFQSSAAAADDAEMKGTTQSVNS